MGEAHEGKRRVESLWPVHQITWQKSRYVYDMYYVHGMIEQSVYDYCIRLVIIRKLVSQSDRNLCPENRGCEPDCKVEEGQLNPRSDAFLCRVSVAPRSDACLYIYLLHLLHSCACICWWFMSSLATSVSAVPTLSTPRTSTTEPFPSVGCAFASTQAPRLASPRLTSLPEYCQARS